MTVRRRSKPRGRGLSLRPVGCAPALSVTYAPLQLQFASVILCLNLYFETVYADIPRSLWRMCATRPTVSLPS